MTWMRERVLELLDGNLDPGDAAVNVLGALFGRFADGRITHWLEFNDLALLPG